MIELGSGNLLDAQADALVNTVNTVGVMGKGLAFQFKRRFPRNYAAYAAACKRGEVDIGRMFVFVTGDAATRYIINFPTKKHWRNPSEASYVADGLRALVDEVRERAIMSVAVPPLGCGNGGLDWQDVEPMIREAFASLPDVKTLIFPPSDIRVALAPAESSKLNRFRALLVKLIESYRQLDYALTKIEMQKLTYFLQEAGEDLRLQYTKNEFGPYAAALRHVLIDMEGTFLQGVGDQTQRAEIRLLPGTCRAAEEVLAGEVDANEKLERVKRLIRGFETPYAMELLATVHWVARHDALTPEGVVAAVQSWTERKKSRYQPKHILKAWQRLEQQRWLPS